MAYAARAETVAEWLRQSRLARLPRIEITPQVEQLALEAQHQLARDGHHRLPPTDLVITACAEHAGVGVLRYDHDYDVLAKHTTLAFDSEWLAPVGTL